MMALLQCPKVWISPSRNQTPGTICFTVPGATSPAATKNASPPSRANTLRIQMRRLSMNYTLLGREPMLARRPMATQGKRHRFDAGSNLTVAWPGMAFLFKRLAEEQQLLWRLRDYQPSFQSAKSLSACQQQHGRRECQQRVANRHGARQHFGYLAHGHVSQHSAAASAAESGSVQTNHGKHSG